MDETLNVYLVLIPAMLPDSPTFATEKLHGANQKLDKTSEKQSPYSPDGLKQERLYSKNQSEIPNNTIHEGNESVKKLHNQYPDDLDGIDRHYVYAISRVVSRGLFAAVALIVLYYALTD